MKNLDYENHCGHLYVITEQNGNFPNKFLGGHQFVEAKN